MASNVSVNSNLSDLITDERIIEYAEIKRKHAVSIELIHGIIGGANMKYVCCHADQSVYIYKRSRDKYLKNQTITIGQLNTSEKFKSHLWMRCSIVMLKPKTSRSREHIVMWAWCRCFLWCLPNNWIRQKVWFMW